jgi:hypothetical protein
MIQMSLGIVSGFETPYVQKSNRCANPMVDEGANHSESVAPLEVQVSTTTALTAYGRTIDQAVYTSVQKLV